MVGHTPSNITTCTVTIKAGFAWGVSLTRAGVGVGGCGMVAIAIAMVQKGQLK